MPSSTKAAIITSFLRLVGKKPFDKITVRDIVDDCDINRNTFYYYFQDIYAVLEEICEMLLMNLPEEATLSQTLCEFCSHLLIFTERYPRAARGLALSFGFEGLGRYFGKRLDAMIAACLSRQKREGYTEVCFLRHAVLGLCLDFMRDEKCRTDPDARLAELREVVLRFED